MIWNLSEQSALSEVIAHIEQFRGLRCASFPSGLMRLRLSDAEGLRVDLADPHGGALLVRHLLKALEFDEGRLFAFRFEHKLIQALVLQHYCPGVVPTTLGASRELGGLTPSGAERKINETYDEGFILKASLATGSGELSVGKRVHASTILHDAIAMTSGCLLADEKFIFQQKIDIVEEYRVHSVEDTVVPGITFLRYSPEATSMGSTRKVNEFVQEIIDELPSGLIRDSLYGWDIAIDRRGNPVVIETNVAGMHPFFRRGFQCSGFFQTRAWGVPCLARLISSLEQIYGITLDIEAPRYPRDEFARTYFLVSYYRAFRHTIENTRVFVTPNKRVDFLPTNISNNLSAEENTLLWVLSETTDLEGAVVRGADSPGGAGPRELRSRKSTEQNVIGESGTRLSEEVLEASFPAQFESQPPSLHRLSPEALALGRQKCELFFRQMLGDVDESTVPYGLLLASDTCAIDETNVELDAALVASLRRIAQKLETGTETLIHLAWAHVLARTSGRDDVIFGTALYGRLKARDGESTTFRNVLPVRINCDEGVVAASVARTHTLLSDLRHHQRASVSLAHRCSAFAAHTPLFTVVLDYHSVSWGVETLDGAAEFGEATPLYPQEIAPYPVMLSVDDRDDGILLTARVQGSTDSARICDFAHTALLSLTDILEAAPSSLTRRIEVLPASERQTVLYDWNDTGVPFDPEQYVHELFETQTREDPGKMAVEYAGRDLKYGELNASANRLAHHLRNAGVGCNGRVAICLERGPEMVIALMAVLKTGGAYLPLDPAYPRQRIKHMLEESAPSIVLTEEHLFTLFDEFKDDIVVLEIGATMATCRDRPDTDVDRGFTGISGEAPAYIIYTSGSTGTPKGVQISHSSLTNNLWSMQRELRVGSSDVFLGITTLSFDIAVLELMFPLTLGASIRILSRDDSMSGDRLIEEINNKVTVVQTTPTRWQMIFDAGWKGKTDLKALCGGEVLNMNLAKKLLNSCESSWNVYGPTETTLWSLVDNLTESHDRVAIGRPIANTRAYILNRHGEPAPIGAIGEVYIGGTGVARGYIKRPELTAERFVPDPYLVTGDARMYMTGDLGRWLPDGRIEFAGRRDLQVKLRGHRIELGEIEEQLAAYPGVSTAVAAVREDAPGEEYIAVYYMPVSSIEHDGDSLSAAELRAHLSAVLPDYMVPAAYVRLASLPLTPSGKIDRKALPQPLRNASGGRFARTPQEEALCSLFAEVLSVDRVGIDDDFFDLGGNSLLAIRLCSRIQSTFGIGLSLGKLFAAPSVVKLVDQFDLFAVSLIVDPGAADSW